MTEPTSRTLECGHVAPLWGRCSGCERTICITCCDAWRLRRYDVIVVCRDCYKGKDSSRLAYFYLSP